MALDNRSCIAGRRHKIIGQSQEKQKRFGKIGVFMGGASSEREISLKSGKAVYEALRESGVDVVCIDIKSDKKKENICLINSYKIDCAFIALHGRFGEDGQIQKILETLMIPYTGSGVRASRIAMDKIASKRIFKAAGLNVPACRVLSKSCYEGKFNLNQNLGFPLVVKPSTHGSSIGLSIIDKKQDLRKAVEFAFDFDEKVIIEEYIAGRELTVGILDDCALPAIEIIPKKKFFDYEAKYTAGLSEYVVPADLEDGLARRIRKAALFCHRVLGCFGCSRVDIILNKDNLAFVLEVNTIPGMTNTSLLPKAARVVGIEFNELCLKLIKLAYCRQEF